MAAGAVQDSAVSTVTRCGRHFSARSAYRSTSGRPARGTVPLPSACASSSCLSPSHRLGREVARDLLFPQLATVASAKALSKALSLAREALAPLGPAADALLRTDRTNIWVGDELLLDVDAEAHERRRPVSIASGL
jgi:DNA-binding SARP family transcriptional activator